MVFSSFFNPRRHESITEHGSDGPNTNAFTPKLSAQWQLAGATSISSEPPRHAHALAAQSSTAAQVHCRRRLQNGWGDTAAAAAQCNRIPGRAARRIGRRPVAVLDALDRWPGGERVSALV